MLPRISRIARFAWLASVSTAAALGAGCSSRDTTTQITVALTSETQIPKELNEIEVVVTAPDGSEVSRVLTNVQSPNFFPATLAIIPRDEGSFRGAVHVEVRGYLDGTRTQVFRRALVSYVEGRTLLLPMPLRMACFQFPECNAQETCAGGGCRPATVDSAKLADFSESKVFDYAAPDTCFREETCLDAATPVDVGADCTFPIPGDGSAVNVAVQWAAAENRIIALDEGDAVEGWTREGNVGRISAGVCAAIHEDANDPARPVPDKALRAYVSTRCAPKNPLQPYCRAADGSVGIGKTIAVP